jgi:hypothetical protein
MAITELDEVQALLDHVLPDPAGFAQRLAMQVVARWGGQPAGTAARAFYANVATDDATRPTTVITPDWAARAEPPVDMSLLLATALGACDCWGMQPDCAACRGNGSVGWTDPDPELFVEFVQPAVARLSGEHEQSATTPSSEAGS